MVRRFFQDYKKLEEKIVEVGDIESAEMAYPVIENALRQYDKMRRSGHLTR